MMWGWWFPGILVMVVCIMLMARMMGHGHGHGSRSHESERQGRDVPERILANRLASGEIDVDEHERLRDALQHRTSTSRSALR